MRRIGLAVVLMLAPLALVAGAQQTGKIYRIGFLSLTPGENATLMKALLERLQELGYSEGRNMTFEYRSAEGRPEQLPHLATELVRAFIRSVGGSVLIASLAVEARQAGFLE
jgi:putative ABC transport system substrate-binding protein